MQCVPVDRLTVHVHVAPNGSRAQPQRTPTPQSTGWVVLSQALPRRRGRLGATSLEVLVAFTLLTSILSFSVPLIVRNARLLRSHSHYRLALDELSNQLDRLTALPEGQRREALEDLAPSPFAAARLPGVKLQYEWEPLDIGHRLTLFVTWDEPQRRRAPVAMAAWVYPDRSLSDGQGKEDGEP